MAHLAYLTEQNQSTNNKQLDRILFALCRFEAWRIRKQVGKSRTVVFTLPGQSCTTILLPAIQRVFPCERHVFVYDNCIDSTTRAYYQQQQTTTDVSNTTPIQPLVNKYLVNEDDFAMTLSCLSSAQHASIVESWMSSVDAFIKLKHSSNKLETEYVPFVCRLGYLLANTGQLGNGLVDVSDVALSNVLQYITGSRSRPLDNIILAKARDTLIQCQQKYYTVMTKQQQPNQTDIEACVFVHKAILIGNTTLLDTVQPKKEWSLKAAKKLTACACCSPEDDDEDLDEDNEEGEGEDFKISRDQIETSPVVRSRYKPRYVDGKSTFAFDPSKFTMIAIE